MRATLPNSLIIFFLATLPLLAQSLEITVEVNGLQSDVGGLVLKVYNKKEQWLSDDTVLTQRVALSPGDKDHTVDIAIQLEAGDYAFSVHHDDNNNGKLDANFIGIPNEPVGLSNDHRPKFGPPKYKKALLTIDTEGQRVPINLD